MKILNNYTLNIRKMQVKQQSLPILSEQKSYETREYAPYPYLSFGAIHNVKQKKFDIDSAKEKLLRQLNEILEANLDIEELYSIHMRKFLNEKNQFIKKAEMLFLEMQEVEENEFLRPEQRLKKYSEFHKRHMQLEKESRKKWEFVLPKKFDEKIILDNVNLKIPKGKIIGLLGKNGTGKTTLIKLINDLLTPTSGEILINGKHPGIESKEIISYLPEKTYIDREMKVKDAIKYFEEFYDNFDSEKAKKLLKKYVKI